MPEKLKPLSIEERLKLEFSLFRSEVMIEGLSEDTPLYKYHKGRMEYIRDIYVRHGIIFQRPEERDMIE